MGYRSIISLMPKSSVDADAQAFLTAAAITDPTISGAINTLVVQMKADNIWSKMKAVYPMVGGTANSHKFNLKDPRDLDAAFRIVFNGGWTHSNNGATPNGTNGYADTKLIPSNVLQATNAHHAYYLRTNKSISSSVAYGCEGNSGATNRFSFYPYAFNIGWINDIYDNSQSRLTSNSGPSTGLIIGTRASSSSNKIFKNNVQLASTTNNTNGTRPSVNYIIGAYNVVNSIQFYDTNQLAFASIGDGLTDIEAANLYTAVQTFQTTLGRSVGTQTVSDSDAQAFVTNAAIVDQVEATAVNNLVVGMKADGIWSKMKAIYPFVGGSASAHKFNLKDPRDLDAAFRLVFSGGITHNSNGMQGNGVNGFARSKLIPFSNLIANSTHLSYYSRTNVNASQVEIGSLGNNIVERLVMALSYQGTFTSDHYTTTTGRVSAANANSTGFYLGTRTNSNTHKAFKNGTQLGSTNTGAAGDFSQVILELEILRFNNLYYSTKECAFASIGDGLTDTEAANLYTRVQAFQTALSRQV